MSSACSQDADPGDAPIASLSEAQTAELDDHFSEAIGRYRIPGAAVAIMRGREVIYEGTFGTRGVADPAPITRDTRFAVGSLTKSMTSMMVATLVDSGKTDWDARASDVLPGFALSSPASTTRIRVRDLLNGTSGVPRYDSPFFVRTFSPTELIGFVSQIPTVAEPGQVFGYSNAMVSLGGYAAARAVGAAGDDDELLSTYRQLMQSRIFSPIGMPSTTFAHDAAVAALDHAKPHAYHGALARVVETPMEVERFVKSVTPRVESGPRSAIWSATPRPS